MAKKLISTKRLQIDKANANMVIILAVAAFIAVFSLVASRALLSQRSYQSRVISEKKKALAQLKANNEAAGQIVNSYKAFVTTPDNIIGGTATGTGDRDGDNAKIVLDALPSKYDYPALISSIEKILTERNYVINSITGIDDEINQSADGTEASTTATAPTTTTTTSTGAVEMPFDVTVKGNLDTAQGLLDVLQLSIRPMQIMKISLNGGDASLSIKVTAKSYYQPQKKVNITLKGVQ